LKKIQVLECVSFVRLCVNISLTFLKPSESNSDCIRLESNTSSVIQCLTVLKPSDSKNGR